MHLTARQLRRNVLDALDPGRQFVAGIEIIEAITAAGRVLAIPHFAIASVEAHHREAGVRHEGDRRRGAGTDLRFIHRAIGQPLIN